MNALSLLLVVGSLVVIVALMLALLPERQPPPTELPQSVLDAIHAQRLAELRRAYAVAKDELGEEPSFDQVLLTRDSLRTINGTP